MIRRLCARLSFLALVAPLILLAWANGAAASSAGGCVGDHVVVLDQRVDSRAGGNNPPSFSAPLADLLAAGRYEITVVTSDSYPKRADAVQLAEQVVVTIGGATFGPTAELPDGQETVRLVSSGVVELVDDASVLAVSHVLRDTPGNNSVVVECVGLRLLEPEPPAPIDVTVGHTCTAEPSVVIDIVNPGPSVEGLIRVDASEMVVDVGAEGPAQFMHPVDDGPRAVSVDIDGVRVFEGTEEVECTPAADDDELPPPDDVDDGAAPNDPPDTTDPAPDEPAPTVPDEDTPAEVASPEDDADASGDGDAGSTDTAAEDTATAAPPAPPVVEPVIQPLGFVPELTLQVACRDRSITAVVGNAGDQQGSATLALAPSAAAVAVSVDVATTTTIALPLTEAAEGRRVEVVLVTSEGTVIAQGVDIDCLRAAAPEASITVDCRAGVVRLTVANAGEEAASVMAFNEQVAVLGSSDIAGGDQIGFDVAIRGAAVALRVTTSDGTDIFREQIEHGCEQRGVDAGLSMLCPSERVQLRLTNTDDEPRTVDLAIDDEIETLTLEPNEERILHRPLGALRSVQVDSLFGDRLLDESVAEWRCEAAGSGLDCAFVGPASGEDCAVKVRLVVDCATGSGAIDLRNDTADPADIVVTIDERVVHRSTIGGQATRSIPIVESAGTSVAVDVRGVRTLSVVGQCRDDPDRTAAVMSGLLIVLMSIVAAVVARFDPWIRV